jgi:hypothetical protein
MGFISDFNTLVTQCKWKGSVTALEPFTAIGDPPAQHADGNGSCQRPPKRQSHISDHTQEGKGNPEDLSLHTVILV